MSRTFLHTLRFAFCLSAVALLATNAKAETVLANLDFNNGFSNITQTGAAAVGTAGDIWNASASFPGFVGTETPSGNTGGTSPFGAFELLDTAGNLSGISYQMTFVNDGFGFHGPFNNNNGVPATSVANLLVDYLFVGGADAGDSFLFELSGLQTDTDYNVYAYGNGDQPGQGATWTINGTTQTSALATGNSTIDEGEEYALLSFNTGANTTQSFTASELGGGFAVNGFQLSVVNAVPEPSSLAIVMLLGIAGLARRQR